MLAQLGLPVDTLIGILRHDNLQGIRENSFPPPTRESSRVSSCVPLGSNPKSRGDWGSDEESNPSGAWNGERGRGGGGGLSASDSVVVPRDSRKTFLSTFSSLRRRAYARLESGGSFDDHDRSIGKRFFLSPSSASDHDAAAAAAISTIELTTMSSLSNSGVEHETRRRSERLRDASATAAGGTTSSYNGTRVMFQHTQADADGVNDTSTVESLVSGSRDTAATALGDEVVRAGDTMVLSCTRDQMVRFQGSMVSAGTRGLRILGVRARTLPRQGTTVFELVLSGRSEFLSRSPPRDNAMFAAQYGCNVMGFRLKGVSFPRDADWMKTMVSRRPLDEDHVDMPITRDCVIGGGDDERVSDKAVDWAAKNVLIFNDGLKNEVEKRKTAGVTEGEVVDTYSLEGNDGAFGGDSCGGGGGGGSDGSVYLLSSSLSPHLPPFLKRGQRGTVTNNGEKQSSSTDMDRRRPKSRSCGGSENDDDDGCADDDKVGVSAIERGGPGRGPVGSGKKERREGFAAGDVVLVLAKEDFLAQFSGSREFLAKTRVGCLPEPTTWFHVCPLVIFAATLAWVFLSEVDMVRRGERTFGCGGWVWRWWEALDSMIIVVILHPLRTPGRLIGCGALVDYLAVTKKVDACPLSLCTKSNLQSPQNDQKNDPIFAPQMH